MLLNSKMPPGARAGTAFISKYSVTLLVLSEESHPLKPLSEIDFALDELPGSSLHEALAAYRSQAPVARTHFLGLNAWVITSHEALAKAFPDNERFPGHLMYQAGFEPAVGRSFISMEGAEHRAYRKLATPAFRSRAISNYEETGLAELAHELIDSIEAEGVDEVDLVNRYCARFPYLVISRMLGRPRDREEEFHGWALGLLRGRDDPAAGKIARDELTRFLVPIVEARRAEPKEDVISALVHAEIDGRSLTDEEVHAHIRLLFPTGGETTHGTLGNLLSALLTHPEAWQTVVADRTRADDAVSEALRWETSIAVLPRMSAAHEIEFHGATIAPSSWTLFAPAAANRDPAIHADPDRFDLDRRPSELLTFGRGAKSCPGMHLARRNMVVSLEILAERFPNMRLLDYESAQPRRTVLRSPDMLRVRLR